jgi:hypothetical protein
MRLHELKVWPKFFEALADGSKTFEARWDDRVFIEGDVLHLREWDNEQGVYTGRSLTRHVTYILRGPAFGVERGYVVMALKPEGA